MSYFDDNEDYIVERMTGVSPGYEKEHNMSNKLRNAAIILDEHLTTIKAYWAGSSGCLYTFLCPKPLARDLAKDDLVIVRKTNGDMSVVVVAFIDEESDVNLDSSFSYQFAFQRVDTDMLKRLTDTLDESEKELKRQQRTKLREQVKNDLTLEYKGTVIEQGDGS